MQINDYQAEALRFRLPTASPEYALLSVGAEVGELYSLISKAMRDGRKFSYDQELKKELGDILWNVAAIAADHGFTLEDVCAANITKLTIRKLNNTLQDNGNRDE